MSLQSVAHPDIAKIHSMLSKMDGPQLQQFAATHQDNAVYVSLAMQVDKDRKQEAQRLQALMSGREQPNVMQQAVAALNPQGMAPPGMGGQGGAPMPPPGGPQGPMPPQGMPMGMPPPGMQMPPPMPPAPQMPPPSGPNAAPQGLAGLPAQNIQHMADGGIAGYADADEAVGYADGGVVHMAGGGDPEDAAIRAQGRSLGLSDEMIDQFVERRKAQTPQRDLPSAPVKTSGIGVPETKMQNLGEAMPMPTPIPNPRMTGETPAIGPNDRNPLITREQSPSSGIAPTRTNLGNATDQLPDLRQFSTDLEAGRIRAVPGGGIVPMTPGQGSFKDRSLGNREPDKATAAAEGPPIKLESLYGTTPATGTGSPTGAGPRAGRPGAGAGAGAGAGLPTLLNPNAGVVTPGAGASDKALAALLSKTPVGGPPTLDMPQKLTPAQAMQNVGEFFNPNELYARADNATTEKLGRAKETEAFVRQNKPGLPFQELAKRLDTEEFKEIGEKEKAQGMAIMMAGLKMMESPYGGKGLGAFLRNMGAGATVGVKELQQANKEFKELAQKRMQMRTTIEAAQDAAKRGDFDRELSLRMRADQISDTAEDLKMAIAQTVWGNKAQGALSAYNHAENVYNQFRLEGFKASNEAYLSNLREEGQNTRLGITQAGETERYNAGQIGQNVRHAESERGATTRHAQSEAGANARNAATLKAAREARIFEASLPPESIRAAGYLGGAAPGTLPTPAQVKAGIEITNSDKFNVYTAYSKYVTDWKRDPNPANLNDRMMTFPEYMAMFGAGKVIDKLPANATVRNPQ